MPSENVITHELPEELKTAVIPILKAFFHAHGFPCKQVDRFEQISVFRPVPNDPDTYDDNETTVLARDVDGVQVLFLNIPHILRMATEMLASGGDRIPLPALVMVYLIGVIYNSVKPKDKERIEPNMVLLMYADFVSAHEDFCVREGKRIASLIQEQVNYLDYCLRVYDAKEYAFVQDTAEPPHAKKAKQNRKPAEDNSEVEFTIAPLNKKPKTQEG